MNQKKQRNIFLTGGTGFFGKSILSMVKRGFASGYTFTILSREPDTFLAKNPEFAGMEQISFVHGDVRDFIFPSGHFDFVIHAGAPAMAMPPGVERDIILRGTERVLAFAKQCGAEKFMFVSSGAVYGIQPPDLPLIPETFPCNPVTEYGIAKLEAEEMCKASNLYILLPRCFAFTGPYLNREIHFAIGNFIRDALRGDPIVIKGDGTPYRSYLHADDLVRWLFAVLERGRNGIPYNIGSDDAISISHLAVLVKQILNSMSEILIVTLSNQDKLASRYVPDISRISMELDVSQIYSLREAITNSITEEEKRHEYDIIRQI